MFRRQFHPSLDAIEPMARDLVAWGRSRGVDTAAAIRLNLVLDELITNIVLYGAGSGQQHVPAAVVQLEVGATPRGVEVCLRDSGVVFNPLERPPADTAASLEDREVGGLGIHFLREMAQDLHWQRAGGMNELRFVMPTQPSP